MDRVRQKVGSKTEDTIAIDCGKDAESLKIKMCKVKEVENILIRMMMTQQ